MVKKSIFGNLPNGQTIMKFTISNSKGEYVELLDYGASIHSLYVMDRNGVQEDVVLGVGEPAQLIGRSFEGSTIGRCANRISYGKYRVDGNEVQLECNMSGHFLHGASGNYANKLFEGSILEDGQTVVFKFLDIGEGGFDCNVEVHVQYRFNDKSELSITYEITPDGTTVISPTNHCYFNLSGGDVRDHYLRIHTDQRTIRDENGLPCGGTESVVGTPCDFTSLRTIREAMDSDQASYFKRFPKRFDEFYVLQDQATNPVAELYDHYSGRRLKVYTDMQALILFTGIAEKETMGKNGAIYHGYCGICLETQFVPNAVNCVGFSSPVFRKGEKYKSVTVYAFSIDNKEVLSC